MSKIGFILLFVLSFNCLQAREKVSLSGRIVDAAINGNRLEFAQIILRDSLNSSKNYYVLSDKDGKFIFKDLNKSIYTIQVHFMGYKTFKRVINLNSNLSLIVKMEYSDNLLDEVVVVGVESKGATSSTLITREAMDLLQPSSFSDILELLPGGKSYTPSLSNANTIKLREVGGGEDYSTSSLGTAFMIDGAPISTDANMQYTTGPEIIIGGGGYADSYRSTVNKGVDMRTISTDQIEKVEIVRGIPSVKYGDLTSGLVKIERKKGYNPLEARIKVDGLSKLFAASKGFAFKDQSINIGLDYLDAKAQPTNNFENYSRITGSARYNLKWMDGTREEASNVIRFNSNFDYARSLDDVKTDPNTGYAPTDSYKSTYNRFSLMNKFIVDFNKSKLFEQFEFISNISYEMDRIDQTRLVQITRPTPIPNTTETGESDAILLPGKWVSELTVDGRPLSVFLNANATMSFNTYSMNHKFFYGAEYRYDKNFGDGQVYDVKLPPSPSMGTRPRKYSDIPSGQEISFFVEDRTTLPIGNNILSINAGIRGTSILNLEDSYLMRGRVFIDPRVNLNWRYKHSSDFEFNIGGGIGWHTKKPTLNQLYPDWVYVDLVQLNYYHNNPDLRRINLMTYKDKFVNFDLMPAHNRKWEVRFSFDYKQHSFSVNYFQEYMNDGFRSQSTMENTRAYTYKRYDTSNLDSSTLSGPPDVNTLPYVMDTVLYAFSSTTNGSIIDKRGVEFSYSSKRIEAIRTRITVYGAWFKSYYNNSAPILRGASRPAAGKYIEEIGIYESTGGRMYETFNTNFLFDTYIPSLKILFSTTFQCTWFSSEKSTPYSGVPYAYISKDGTVHPYTEKELNDPYLQTLKMSVNDSQFEKRTVPFGMNINFKFSKEFKKFMKVSLFVNNILCLYPEYEVNGVKFKRNRMPYFGAEIKLYY